MIDLNRIYQFIRIVEAGNISRAAGVLGVPKSMVSRNLALLEREIGQQLVYRTTRQFHLTETGRQLFEVAKPNLSQIEDSLEQLQYSKEEVAGSIRITAPDDIGIHVLTEIFDEFKKTYPKVNFEIYYSTEILDLVAEGIDVAIRIGNLKDSSLRKRQVGFVEIILVASADFLKAQNRSVTLENILELPTVSFGRKSRTQQWHLQSKEEKISLRIQPTMMANNYMAVCDLVMRGHGVGFLPKFLCEPHLKSGALVQILKPWSNAESPIQLLLPGQKETPKRIRVFSDFCIQKLSKIF